MRGNDTQQGSLFSFVDAESRIPMDHPLRPIRELTNAALKRLDGLFDEIYSDKGRPSIPPERLIRALLVQILYTIRSERQLMEQVNYNILYRWFIGLGMDDDVWDPSVFTKNRDRLLEGEVCKAFFLEIVAEAESRGLLSKEHFSVDGTLLDAWASMKSFRRKDGNDEDPGPGRNGERNWKGEKLSNETHESRTDPDSRLARKSYNEAARLTYQANTIIENRSGLVIAAGTTVTSGTSERDQALELLDEIDRHARATVGADKGFDTKEFCAGLRERGITPHVAQKQKGSAIDGRTVRHPGYQISQTIRKRVEEPYGWAKSYGLLRKLRHRGLKLVGSIVDITFAAYDMVRMCRLASA